MMPLNKSFPPFYITQEYQYMGTVFRRLDEQKPGCIIVVMDLHSIFVQYIGLLKSGQYGSGYALDERGVILFDRETEIIGRSIFDGMHDAFPEVEALDKRIIAEDTGMANYAFTITRGQKVYRKLVAWNTVKFKGRKIIVALSAPDTEINATLEELRNFYIMLGGVLALLLATITLKLLRRKQHLELLESVERFKELSKSTWEGILIHKDGDIRLVNEQFYAIFGYDESDSLEEMTASMFFSQKALKKMEQQIVAGDKNLYETEGKRKDGSTFPLEVRVRETEFLGETVRIATLRDITEYKMMLEVVRSAERKLQRNFQCHQ